jgi:tetratricopeptide (TPR) repeat protein
MARTWNKYQHAIQKGWIPPQAIGTWFLDLQTLFKDDPAAGEAFVKDLTNGKITPTQSSGLAAYYKEFGEDYLDKSIEIIDAGLDYPTITSDERAGLLMLRGGLLVESKRYEEGVASFQILANESNSPLVQNNIAYIVGVYQDKPTEGLAIAKGAAKLAPRNPSVIDTVAELYSRIGSYQKAADTLDFLLQLNPSNSIAMAKLSLLYTEHLGDPERGIVYAQRGRSQTPRAPEVLDAMGWGYYRTGKKDLARESIERSILQGDTLNAYLHLAQIVTEDLEFEKALGHIRMAEELTEDAYSMRRIQTLKDDIRKKQTENADN